MAVMASAQWRTEARVSARDQRHAIVFARAWFQQAHLAGICGILLSR